MGGVTFEAIQREERTGSTAPFAPGKLPRFVPGQDLNYPMSAMRLNKQGPVDLEFSIDGQGHVQNLNEIYAPSSQFGAVAVTYLQGGVFKVPPDWESLGSRERFTIEFQFTLVPRGATCPAPQALPRIPNANVIRICSHQL